MLVGVRDFISKAFKWRAPPKTPIEPTVFRSGLDEIHFTGSDYTKIPAYPFSFRTLYEVYKASDILRIVIDTLRREIFREGFEIRERFKLKCARCGKEFHSIVDMCDSCGSTMLLRPSTEQEKMLKRLISEPVNASGEYLIDVLNMLEIDLDVTDNAYVLLVKTYYYDEAGRIVGADIDEIVRLSPLYVQIIMDSKGRVGFDDDGNKLYVCPANRRLLLTEPVCPDGKQAIRAGYKVSVSVLSGAFSTHVDTMYYGVDEIIHLKRWMPQNPYGHSPIYAIWQKVLTLMYQDRFMLTYFQKQRPPRGLLAIVSDNAESIKKMWQELREASRRNPHDIFPILIESQKPGKNIQFIDLMRSLPELQFTEVRNEYRRTIGAMYGVLPLFSGDLPTGWNNEGTQVLVTNRAVMWAQETYNRHLFPKLLKQLGITDWELRLKKPEKKDQMAEVELLLRKAQLMEELQALGFDVEFTHEGEVKWSKKPSEEKVQEDRKPPKPTGSANVDEQNIEGGVRGMSGYPSLTDFLDMTGAPPNLRRKSISKAGKEGKVPIKIRRRDGVVQTYWVRPDKVHEFEQRQREQGNEIISVGGEAQGPRNLTREELRQSFEQSLSKVDPTKVKRDLRLYTIEYEGKGFKVTYYMGHGNVQLQLMEGYDAEEVKEAIDVMVYKHLEKRTLMPNARGYIYTLVVTTGEDGSEKYLLHVPRKEFFAVARLKGTGARVIVPKAVLENPEFREEFEEEGLRELTDEEYEYLKKVAEVRFLTENKLEIYKASERGIRPVEEDYAKDMNRLVREVFERTDYVFRGVRVYDPDFAEELVDEGVLKHAPFTDYQSFSVIPNVAFGFGNLVFAMPKKRLEKMRYKIANYVFNGTSNGDFDGADRIDAGYGWEQEVRVGDDIVLDKDIIVFIKGSKDDFDMAYEGFLQKLCERVTCVDVSKVGLPFDTHSVIFTMRDLIKEGEQV